MTRLRIIAYRGHPWHEREVVALHETEFEWATIFGTFRRPSGEHVSWRMLRAVAIT